jgi:hypothetical protein
MCIFILCRGANKWSEPLLKCYDANKQGTMDGSNNPSATNRTDCALSVGGSAN